MKYLNYFFIIFLLNSCSGVNYKFKLNTSQKVKLGDNATISFKQIDGNKVDSTYIFINDKKLRQKSNLITINTSKLGVGKHIITALVFYPGKVKKIKNFIEVFSNKVPILYDYKIINEYPHDKNAFTQGLEFYNGYLYETTGKKGKSWLRKIDLKTGKVLKQEKLDESYFGEGMTIFNDEIFWLTWQAKKGFVYNLDSFKKKREFKYNKSFEGWGLTHNDRELIKSDGTNKIWFLNSSTQKEKRYIEAYTNKTSLKRLNELEWVDGKIYANYWQKPLIAIINPNNGVVDGIINLKGLVAKMKKIQKLDSSDDVLNGIAYDKKNKRLFVTGKHWSKIFEIELIKF